MKNQNFNETAFFQFVQANKQAIAQKMVDAYHQGQYACIAPSESAGAKITTHNVGWDTRPRSIGFGSRASIKTALNHIEEILWHEDWHDAIHFEENIA